MIHDEEPNDDEIMVSFTDLQFDPKEENVPVSLIMSSKQFKVLKKKFSSSNSRGKNL